MVKDWKCPFCGSAERYLPTGFVKGSGHDSRDMEEEYTFCCSAQKKNQEFIEKNYDPDHRPDPDDISKL